MKQIILASASPRRKELLERAGVKFTVVESKFKERFDPKLTPRENAEKLSFEKAKAVYRKNPLRQLADGGKDSVIIAADTLVVCDGKILGKPTNENDVTRMLSMLSNKTHSVITGLTIISKQTTITKSQTTKISMGNIDKAEIEKYSKTQEPYDKAGAYAIQGWAKKFITKIDGDLSNAIGLTLKPILKFLKNSELQK